MTRIRNLVLRVVMAAAAFLLAAYSYAGEAIDLQLRWHHQFQFAGYYAAVEKGFYQGDCIYTSFCLIPRISIL